ncbi:MAG: hypothetical protein ACI9S8_000820 [Chlamydiales bacterium]|jgi:hypothetical protein
MSVKRFSEDDLYEFAAQILLEEKRWPDFGFLSEDDKAKVLMILRRGRQALSKANPQSNTKVTRKNIRDVVIKEGLVRRRGGSPQQTFLRPSHSAIDKPQPDYTKLAQRVGFIVFPLAVIVEESEVLRRKFMEAVNRRIAPNELPLLFRDLSAEDAEILLGAISRHLAEEVAVDLQDESKEWSDYESNTIYAKYSVAAAKFLSESDGVSTDLKLYLEEYQEKLRVHLGEYCKSLPEKYGLLEILGRFTQTMWVKLAGLTPRKDMSFLFHVLPSEFFDKLLFCLPPAQKEDVKELIAYLEREKQGEISVFVDILDTLTQWVDIVKKLADPENGKA